MADTMHDSASSLSRRWFQNARSGSEEAWSALFDRYHWRLLTYAAISLGPRLRAQVTAEDVVQEAWLRTLKSLGGFKYEEKGALRRRVAQHVSWVCAEWGRSGAVRLSANAPDAAAQALFMELAEGKERVSSVVGYRDLLNRLTESLDDERMPEPYKEMIVRTLFEEKPIADTAAEMNIKVDTVRKQYSRALDRWREILGNDPLSIFS